MKDDDLRRQVAAELAWDPQVDSETIEVSVASGTVTLVGTAESLRLKLMAHRAVTRVRGVISIADQLRVAIPDEDCRDDDEDLRGDVLEALMLDVSVPMTVGVHVRTGFVTLTGTAEWHYQREAAEFRASNVPGVVGIDNGIALSQTPDADAAQAAITCAFRRNAVLDADLISVETSSGGLVILSGAVSSRTAHDQALATAWSAPGVTSVDDRILVERMP